MTQNDIVIVGSGIIGASLAYQLAKQKSSDIKVTLLETYSTVAHAGTASYASAGIISPASRLNTPSALLTLTQRSLELYPQFAAALKEEQPDPTGYRETGQLSLAANTAEVRGLKKRLDWYINDKVDPQAKWLSTQEVSELEPLAGPNEGALYQPVAVVRTAWLTRAIVQAAARLGITVKYDSEAVALLSNNKRVTGVKLKDGSDLQAAKVVVAAGAWSGLWLDKQLKSLEQNIVGPYAEKIYPVRGQMLSIQPSAQVGVLNNVLVGSHGYAIPRAEDGGQISVAFGATEEHAAGFSVVITSEGLRELSLLVHKLAPALEKEQVRQVWAGLRPGSKTDMPMLGPLPELPGLWVASGHFRSGILLAPATAELMADALLNESEDAIQKLQPFSTTNESFTNPV